MSPTRPDVSAFLAHDAARQRLLSRSPESRDVSPSFDGQEHSPRSPTAGASGSGEASGVRQKRRADTDLVVVAQRASQRLKLKHSSEQTLVRFTERPSEERDVHLMAYLLSFSDRLDRVQPAQAMYTIPSKILSKIELYSADVLLCPVLTTYIKQPTKIVMDILSRHPTWGYTRDVSEDPSKQKTILDRVQTRLSDRRNAIKSVIAQSIGSPSPDEGSEHRVGSMHIVDVIEAMLAKVHKAVMPGIDNTRITIQMCARVAFLRQIYRECPGNAFFKEVDRALKEIRDEFDGKAVETLSLYMSSFLQRDLEIYGQVDLDVVVMEHPSEAQVEVDHFASGTSAQLDAPDDNEDD